MKVFTILSTVLIACYYYFNTTTHKFWSKQPVSRPNIEKEGIISTIPRFKITLDAGYYFKELNLLNNPDQLIELINTHFSDNYIYSKTFLTNTLHYSGLGYNVGLFF